MSLTPETTEIVFDGKPAVKRVWRDSKGQEVRTTINGKPVDANGNIVNTALTKEEVIKQKAEADKKPVDANGNILNTALTKEEVIKQKAEADKKPVDANGNLFCATFIDNHQK